MCEAFRFEFLSCLQWIDLLCIYYLCQAEEMILIGDKNGDGKIEYEGSYYKPVKIALDKHCCRRNTDIFRC